MSYPPTQYGQPQYSQQYPSAAYPSQGYPPAQQTYGQEAYPSYPAAQQAYPTPYPPPQSYPAQPYPPQHNTYPSASAPPAGYPGATSQPPTSYAYQSLQNQGYAPQQPAAAHYAAPQPMHQQPMHHQPVMHAAAGVHPVVDAKYCAPMETGFILQEKVGTFSGDDFTIMDFHGNRAFRVDSRAISIADKRVMKDAHGNAVASMKKKVFAMKDNWMVCRGPFAEKQYEVAKLVGEFMALYPKVKVYTHGNRATPDYTIQGNFREKNFQVYYHGTQLAAEVSRKSMWESSKKFWTGKDTYALRVLPGFDHAFMLAVVIVLDEMYND